MKRRLGSYDAEFQDESSQESTLTVVETKPRIHRQSSYPPCQVCGDRSSGLHYGVITCNGCRSFFRRAIGGKKNYECEYGEDCVIDVKARAQCKACRLKKSLEVGMRPEEVIMYHKPKSKKGSLEPDVEDEDSCTSLDTCLVPLGKSLTYSTTYNLLWNIRNNESQLDVHFAPTFPKQNLRIPSQVQDIFDAIQIELHYLVGWAKCLDVFQNLEAKSKVALLRTHCTEFIYLEASKRYILALQTEPSNGGELDYFVGANGLKVRRTTKSIEDIKGFDSRMACPIKELMDPCRALRVTEEELLCLKALVLFNPYTNGLTEKDRVKVGVFQQQLRKMLENIAEDSSKEWGGSRLFNLLLLLPSLSNIAEQLRGNMRAHRVNGFTTTYRLLNELVLDEINGMV